MKGSHFSRGAHLRATRAPWHDPSVSRDLAPIAALLLAACTTGTARTDAGDARVDAGEPRVDAGLLPDAGPLCGCTGGLHNSRIFLMSDQAELWMYDPIADAFEFVVGPVCATVDRPFSMAIDPRGLAWVQYIETRRVLTIDVNDLRACEDSGYLPTVREFPHFGMSFVQRGACASLYGLSYSGGGEHREGPGLGYLGRVEGDPPRMTTLAPIDYDGGELAGTGDGRLFGFTGVDPAKLVELDPDTGETIDVLPLDGISLTYANAFAFFAGDVYLFTEALPTECDACFERECPEAWAACEDDSSCVEQVACAIETASVMDDCGGGAGGEMLSCMSTCSDACFVSPRARVSQVTRIDWDESDGAGRAITVVRRDSPLRVVGAGTSPCVPTVPF